MDVAIGLSAFNIVGLPDNTIRESRDRILAALSNCGFALPLVSESQMSATSAYLNSLHNHYDYYVVLRRISVI